MNYMFKDIQNIISVKMNSTENCKITSMISTFENCLNLITFYISGFKGDKLLSMQKLFFKSGLSKFYFPNDFTSNVEDMSYMLAYTEIIEFTLNDFDTNKVKNMSHILEGCSSLKNINMSNIDTNKVEDISYMFHSCEAIIRLDLTDFDTSQVIDMSHLFEDCISLSEINISNFDTSNVKDMSYMFENCHSL